MTRDDTHVSVLPTKEGTFIIEHMLDHGEEVFAAWPRYSVALGESPIAYGDAMSELRKMRSFGIFSIAPLVIESRLDQDEINRRLASVKSSDVYIEWCCALTGDPSVTFEEMRERVNRPMTEGAIAIFDDMEANALSNPFDAPFPIELKGTTNR